MKLIRVSNALWRGSQPWSDSDWDLVERAGIRTVIKLNEAATGNRDEGWSNRDRPLLIRTIPDAEAQSTLSESVRRELNSAIDFINMANKDDAPIFVHCTEGVDRTGFVIATYRVIMQGWAPRDAHDEWVAMGSHRYVGLEREWAERWGNL